MQNNKRVQSFQEKEDTIVAISTPLGEGGIGIVRMSGPNSILVASQIFRNNSGKIKRVKEFKSHYLYHGKIMDQFNQPVDEVMLVVMKKPNSYTRQNMVEINCHGGILVVKKILEIIIKSGARLAEPGEFTKLAFLNGRIDLSQAEAVIDVIQSKNEKSLKSSFYQLSGGLKEKIFQLRKKLIDLNSRIEAPMDFPDQGIENISRTIMLQSIKTIFVKINDLLETYQYGQLIKEGICTIILGKANVGKSSLFNLLIKKERSIVTELPGTTRDIIEEQLVIDGYSFNLIDTAGMKSPDNIVEELSLEKLEQLLEYAQLLLLMFDISQPMDAHDWEIIRKIRSIKDKNIRIIIILNKTDLPEKLNQKRISQELEIPETIKVSIKRNTGIDLLKRKMLDAIINDLTVPSDNNIITNKRQHNILIKSKERLQGIIKSIKQGIPDDFIVMDLKYIINQLAMITGETCDDEIIETIFSKFCIGK